MKNRTRLAAVSAVAVGLLLSACATSANNSGGGASGAPTEEEKTPPKLTNCTNKIERTTRRWSRSGPGTRTCRSVVDNFNEDHNDVQVCWTNAGAGRRRVRQVPDGDLGRQGRSRRDHARGRPARRLPGPGRARRPGAPTAHDDVKDNFSEGAWKDVSRRRRVYGAPVDGGPMGMIYRTDVFEKYGITPPTTWDEYEATAQKVKDAGGPLFGDFGANVPARSRPCMYAEGCRAVRLRPREAEDVIDQPQRPGVKEVLDYWAGLVEEGPGRHEDQFTPEYISGVVGGEVRHLPLRRVGARLPAGAGVGKGADAGCVGDRPAAAVGSGQPDLGQLGRLRLRGHQPGNNPELAAKVAFGVYADQASLDEGWKKQIIFPLNENVLDSDGVPEQRGPSSSTASRPTRTCTCRPANAYKGIDLHAARPGLLLRAAPRSRSPRSTTARRPAPRRPTPCRSRSWQVRQGAGFTVTSRHEAASRSSPVRPGGRPRPPGQYHSRGAADELTPPPSTRHPRRATDGPGGRTPTARPHAAEPGSGGSSSDRSGSSSSPSSCCPLGYAFYLSLFQKALIGGTSFVLFDNYVKAFTDPSFLDGVWFVIRFSLVLIPLQMARLARDRADPRHRDHAVRPVLAAHDLPAVRDPDGDRRPDVGVPLQRQLRPAGGDLRALRRDRRRLPAQPRPRSSTAC